MKKKGRQTKQAPRRGSIGIILALIVSALMFATGFFLAGRQHFSSVDYGMKNSKLRKQIEDLESEKRRLILAREVSMSPNEIRKAAKKAGLLQESSDQPQQASLTQASAKQTPPTPALTRAAAVNPLVIKTASVAQTTVASKANIVKSKTDRLVKPAETLAKDVKRTAAAE